MSLIRPPDRNELINTTQIENVKLILKSSVIIYFKGKRTRIYDFKNQKEAKEFLKKIETAEK